jgi:transposase InsO family protein
MTFGMIDRNIVCVSPSSTYRVLKGADLLGHRNCSPSKKGTGFEQPLAVHEHWHTDIAYLNIDGTFYYLCSLLDGCSRFIVHWEIHECMTEREVALVIQRGREKFPEASPRIISDNGPQFIAKDFKEFIRLCGMTHVRTSPYYPQSNGKIERWHRSIKGERIRTLTPLSLEDARRIVGEYVRIYNEERLHSAIGYVTPKDMLEGRQAQFLAERDRRLEEARQRRAARRQESRAAAHEEPLAVAAG